MSSRRRFVLAVLGSSLGLGCMPEPDGVARDCRGADVCNGKDDDCDGKIDEDFVSSPCIASVGQCAQGTTACRKGQLVCVSTLEPARADPCDGIDNDCDGRTDEDAVDLGKPCKVGVGACVARGVFVCADDGGTVCSVEADAPHAAETCNGVDDDCNGKVDDGVPIESCLAGLGICAEGATACRDGRSTCEPVRTRQVETCNGLDDDCDGGVDLDVETGESPCRCDPVDLLAAAFPSARNPFASSCSLDMCSRQPSAPCEPVNGGGMDFAFCFTCAEGDAGVDRDAAALGAGCTKQEAPFAACTRVYTEKTPDLTVFDTNGDGRGALRIGYRVTSREPIHAEIRLWIGDVPPNDANFRKYVVLEHPPVVGDGVEHVAFLAPGNLCYPDWSSCKGTSPCSACDATACGAGKGAECGKFDFEHFQIQLTAESCKSPGPAEGRVTLTSLTYLPAGCLCTGDADCALIKGRTRCAPDGDSNIVCAGGTPCSGVCSALAP